MIEDLISTGGSVLTTVEALRGAGAEVLGVVSIFTYNMARARDALDAAHIRGVSLTDFDTVVSVAAADGSIARGNVARLLAFRDDPSDESWLEGTK